MKALIVEDEMVSRAKMNMIIRNYAVCDMAESGEEALEAFKRAWEQRAPYDVITLDINLPGGMNGLDVLVSIRELEGEMNIPEAMRVKVIMVTAHSDKDCVNTSATANCDGYIIKPFAKDDVEKCLREVYLKSFNHVHSSMKRQDGIDKTHILKTSETKYSVVTAPEEAKKDISEKIDDGCEIKNKPAVVQTGEEKSGSEDERASFLIGYIDAVMQVPEFWIGRAEDLRGIPLKEEIDILEERVFNGVMGYTVANRTTGKKFFIPTFQALDRRIVDKLSPPLVEYLNRNIGFFSLQKPADSEAEELNRSL